VPCFASGVRRCSRHDDVEKRIDCSATNGLSVVGKALSTRRAISKGEPHPRWWFTRIAHAAGLVCSCSPPSLPSSYFWALVGAQALGCCAEGPPRSTLHTAGALDSLTDDARAAGTRWAPAARCANESDRYFPPLRLAP